MTTRVLRSTRPLPSKRALAAMTTRVVRADGGDESGCAGEAAKRTAAMHRIAVSTLTMPPAFGDTPIVSLEAGNERKPGASARASPSATVDASGERDASLQCGTGQVGDDKIGWLILRSGFSIARRSARHADEMI